MSEDTHPFLTYSQLLMLLSRHGTATPKDLAESRRRENVIRNQLRELEEYGFVGRVSHDVFSLTDKGVKTVSQDRQVKFQTEERVPLWRESTQRITDLSEIDADTIKKFNHDFFLDPSKAYGFVDGEPEKTEKRIWNVQDLELNRVVREFPTNEPVCQQCAHWVRAISGKHFFPDANHRTAMGSLSALLDLNDIPTPKWPGREIERTVLKAKFIREFVVDVRFDNLWQKDELYLVWNRHFREIFYDVTVNNHHHVPTKHLRSALNRARKSL